MEMWNERYSADEYVYGESPNLFFSEQLGMLKPGRILMPAEGEGRNAVHASLSGWDVSASDQSSAGRDKALALAAKHGTRIDYVVNELATLSYPLEHFDAMGLIYTHFAGGMRRQYHQYLSEFMKSGSIVILEGFSKNHTAHQRINPLAGGPRDVSMLFTANEIKADFLDFETVMLVEQEIELAEGAFHQGTASVIRFVGRKR